MKKFIVLLFVVMVGFSMVSTADAVSRALNVWEYPLDSGCLNTMLTNDSRLVRVLAEQEYDDVVPCPPCAKPVVVTAPPAPIVAPPVVKDPIILIVYFDFDKSNIKTSEQIVIDIAAQYILDNPDVKVILSEGHCDIRGTDDYNMDLGMRRAISVVDALVAKGIDPNIISVASAGEFEPVSDTHWKNRRVYITIK